MPPMTKANRSSVAQTSRNASTRSFQELRGPAGRKPGRAAPMIVMVIMYMATARMPGNTPAMKSLPTSCSVISP